MTDHIASILISVLILVVEKLLQRVLLLLHPFRPEGQHGE